MAKNSNNFISLIQMHNSGKEYPVVKLVKDAPRVAAAFSKLITPRENTATHDNKGRRTINTTNINGFSKLSNEISNKTNEFRSMMEIFPETELAAMILVSLVVSPKDMTKGDINIVAGDNLKNVKVATLLMDKLKSYFEVDYKIKPLVPKMLRNVLIEQGSDPHVIIPENSIDDLINGSSRISFENISTHLDTTGVFKHLGILGNVDEAKNRNKELDTSFDQRVLVQERFSNKTPVARYDPNIYSSATKKRIGVCVVDNIQTLKMPSVVTKNNSLSINEIYNKDRAYVGLGLESFVTDKASKLSDAQLSSLLYKTKHNTQTPFQKIRPDSEMARLTIGAPLVMRFPASAVIPVYTPGNSEKHIGYFLLLDADGNPLTEGSNSKYLAELGYNLNSQNSDMNSYMMQRVKDNLLGKNCDISSVSQITKLYADIVESDLLARVRNGIHGKQVSIASNEDIYRLMLARHFANQMTQLLYVPVELVTYFAYKYDSRGVGISLLNSTRYLNSLRAMLLFSGVLANVRNSIGITKVNMKLDEIDGSPEDAIEMAVHEFMRQRQLNFPVGITAPGDVADWVTRAGYEFSFTGNEGLPDMEIDASETSRSYPEPNNELENELRKRTSMTMGLSPETVDNGFSGDFATSIVANNLLLAKRVMDIQEIMVPQITDHMRKVAMNDGNLITELKKIIYDNFDDLVKSVDENDPLKEVIENQELVARLIVSNFLSNFEASLPKPDSATLENQMLAYETREKAVDAAVKHYVSSELFTNQFGGEAAGNIEDLTNILKSFFMRQWMAENNFLPEVTKTLDELTTMGDENETTSENIFNIHIDHINHVTRLFVKILKDTKPVANAADRDIERITGGEGLDGGGSSDYTSDSDSDSSGGGLDDDFDMGDLDMDMGGDNPVDSGSESNEKTESTETSESTSTSSDGSTTTTTSESSSSSSSGG